MKKNTGARLGVYPTPVVVVGTYDKDGKANIATLAWVGVCCSEPPSVQISLRQNRHTYAAIVERGAFSVNVPSAKYLVETDYAGIASGRDFDKFAATGLTPVRGEVLDVPLVEEFPISMECRLTHTLELGSHDLFVGKIVACWADSEVLLEAGRIDCKKLDPLLFMLNGEYFGIGGYLAASHSSGRRLIGK